LLIKFISLNDRNKRANFSLEINN